MRPGKTRNRGERGARTLAISRRIGCPDMPGQGCALDPPAFIAGPPCLRNSRNSRFAATPSISPSASSSGPRSAGSSSPSSATSSRRSSAPSPAGSTSRTISFPSRARSRRAPWSRQRSKAPSSPGATSSTILVNFLIVAWILFFVVKAINRLKFLEDIRLGAGMQPDTPADVKLLAEIRDILAARGATPDAGPAGEPRRP